MSKIIQISKGGWLKVYETEDMPLYFTNLNQYETIRIGETFSAEGSHDQPYYIELIKPGESNGERITFPTRHDRDEIFKGLARAL